MSRPRLPAALLVVAAALACCRPAAAGEPAYLDRTLSAWVADLRGPDPAARAGAAFALGKIGGQGKRAMEGFVGPLATAVVLQEVTQPGEALLALRDALQADQPPEVREAAAFALGEIGAPIWDFVRPGLAKALRDDPDARVRRNAAYAFGAFEQAGMRELPLLVQALGDESPAVKQSAATALGRIAGPLAVDPDLAPLLADPVKALVRAAGDKDDLVRLGAFRALREVGYPPAKGAVPVLLERLKEETKPALRYAALTALVRTLGPDDQRAAGLLVPVLDDPDPDMRYTAALALGNVGGKEARPAVPTLVEMLKGPDSGLQRDASFALINLGKEAKPALAALTEVLADRERDPLVRRNAAVALGQMGKEAQPAVQALADAVRRDENDEVLAAVLGALTSITGEDNALLFQWRNLVPTLIDLIRPKGRSPWVRLQAVHAVAMQGVERSDAVGLLKEVQEETERATRLVRYTAALHLGLELGPKVNDRTVDLLVEFMNDKEFHRLSGTQARAGGSGAEVAGPGELTGVGNGDHRLYPALALQKIGRRADRADVVRALEDARKSPDADVRHAAGDALKAVRGRP